MSFFIFVLFYYILFVCLVNIFLERYIFNVYEIYILLNIVKFIGKKNYFFKLFSNFYCFTEIFNLLFDMINVLMLCLDIFLYLSFDFGYR